jgi:hypothetical protein
MTCTSPAKTTTTISSQTGFQVMTAVGERPSALRTAPGSARVRLARLAGDAALRVPGVAAVESGPAGLHVTAGDGQRVAGVRCVAAGHGDYELSLRLCCELVCLPELGAAVRASVARAATAAGIAVSAVNVLIADVVEPERM